MTVKSNRPRSATVLHFVSKFQVDSAPVSREEIEASATAQSSVGNSLRKWNGKKERIKNRSSVETT